MNDTKILDWLIDNKVDVISPPLEGVPWYIEWTWDGELDYVSGKDLRECVEKAMRISDGT